MKALKQSAPIAAGLFLVLILTLAAFRLPVLASLQLLWQGAAGDKFGLARTLVKATPLLLTSLGIVVAWRSGMYNIGGEGQFLIGAVCGAVTAKLASALLPGFLNPLILLSCAVGGAVYAGIAGVLQVYRGVQCVISTILLNFVAIQVLDWSVSGPLRRPDTTMPQSSPLPDLVMLKRFDPQSDLHSGVFIALVAALAIFFFMYGTTAGFRLRLTGENPRAATANRISVAKAQIAAMLLSGALAGLAGGIEYTGISGVISPGTSQQWGFLGIPVALLGGLHPIGAIFGSLYFGALFAGSDNLARFTSTGTTVVYVMQAVAVLAYIGFKACVVRRHLRPSEAEI